MAKHFSEVKRELEQPDGHMAGIGQQQSLGREVTDVDAIDLRAAPTQALGHGVEQRRRARMLGRASSKQQSRHGGQSFRRVAKVVQMQRINARAAYFLV